MPGHQVVPSLQWLQATQPHMGTDIRWPGHTFLTEVVGAGGRFSLFELSSQLTLLLLRHFGLLLGEVGTIHTL